MVNKKEIVKLIQDNGVLTDIDSVNFDAPFENYNVDSLDMATILLAIEEKYAIKIPDEHIDQITSINAITKYLEKALNNNSIEA